MAEIKNEENKHTDVKAGKFGLITLLLMVYDVLAIIFSYFIALWVRFDCKISSIDRIYFDAWLKFIPIYVVICICVFWFTKLYQSIWRFASYQELMRGILATVISMAVHVVGITVFFHRMPITYYILGILIQFVLVIGIRFSYRFVLLERSKVVAARNEERGKNIMLIGAGAAGRMIVRDIQIAKETNDKICCIIDDNPNKWKCYIDGVPIVGGREDILANAEKYKIDEILLAIPSISANEKRDILNICKETGCEMKNLPGLYQFVTGEVSLNAMKPVAVEDLLGREQVKINDEEVALQIKDKVVLVTGGGGSIGSELCRQVAKNKPKTLIIFDIYENNAYDIEQELRKKHPNLDLKVLIGSVRDSKRIFQIFEVYHPNIVFHAAAHKHVPLMENSPCEAIKNNVIGTYKTAYAAMKNECERFVLVSTDKAVNPTNIMGASKRLCEMVIQSFDRMIKAGEADNIPELYIHSDAEEESIPAGKIRPYKARTEFVAVRFGNVLGSNGSVIPLFKKQIEAGGPVTVTHPDIIRYFMTIPEAVSLILQAGVYAKGGEIFVLDMGEPVKIVDLAKNMIKLSGFKPDVDIKIEYTGLRPGEKMYEEKLMAEEGIRKTANELIYIGNPLEFEEHEFLTGMEELMECAYNNRDNMKELAAKYVKTYQLES